MTSVDTTNASLNINFDNPFIQNNASVYTSDKYFHMPLFTIPEFKIDLSNLKIDFGKIDFSNMMLNSQFSSFPPFPLMDLNLSYGNFDTFEYSFTNKHSIKYAKLSDYNADKGRKLAEYAYRNMDSSWKAHGKVSDCKAHVRRASEKTGLGTIAGNNGVEALSSLRNNPNYKEISASEIDWQHPPVGTIGIFNPGSQGYNKKHGHTEIYAEVNGKSIGVSSYVINSIKKADHYFIPV